jgi:hypothetical protein
MGVDMSLGDVGFTCLPDVPALRALTLWNADVSERGALRPSRFTDIRILGLREAMRERQSPNCDLSRWITAIEDLDIDCPKTGPIDFSYPHIGQLQSLRTLKIAAHSVDGETIAAIASIRSLRDLHLSMVEDFSDEEIRSICEMTFLKRLRLESRLDDEQYRKLRHCLPTVQIDYSGPDP